MIEKIRISLWDIFTFFITGVFALIAICIFLIATYRMPETNAVLDFLAKLPTTYIIVVAPIVLTLLGLLIKTPAKFFEIYLGKFLFFWLRKDNSTRSVNEAVMKW